MVGVDCTDAIADCNRDSNCDSYANADLQTDSHSAAKANPEAGADCDADLDSVYKADPDRDGSPKLVKSRRSIAAKVIRCSRATKSY
jgi:hypothetical protein